MCNVGPKDKMEREESCMQFASLSCCLNRKWRSLRTRPTLPRQARLQIAASDRNEFTMEDYAVCATANAFTIGDVFVLGKTPLQIVHSDIAGPLKPAENGNIYDITFIDDCTGNLCAYSLGDKISLRVLNSFRHFEAMVERAFSCKIQVLRTDGGNEYNDAMEQYLDQSGIVQQVIAPYTPQLSVADK